MVSASCKITHSILSLRRRESNADSLSSTRPLGFVCPAPALVARFRACPAPALPSSCVPARETPTVPRWRPACSSAEALRVACCS